MFATSVLCRASVVEDADSFAVTVQFEVKEELKVGVEHEINLPIEWINRFPLPMLSSVSLTSILDGIKNNSIIGGFVLFLPSVISFSGQSYKQFTLVIYDSRVVIWGIFQSGTTLES